MMHETVIILLYIPHLRILKESITVLHLYTQRIKRSHHFLWVGDDGVLLIGKLGEVMAFKFSIQAELHLLRVDHHKLEFRRMFLIQKRCDYSVKPN